MLADLRHALRGLAGRPGFTVVAVLTLALAIGATTAIFSVVDGVLLRATPVVDLDRLVMVWETDRHTGTTREPASVPDFLDFQRDSRTMAAIEGVIGTEVNFAPPQGEPVRLAALVASRGLLPMLGIAPIAGRTFSVEEDHRQRAKGRPDQRVALDAIVRPCAAGHRRDDPPGRGVLHRRRRHARPGRFRHAADPRRRRLLARVRRSRRPRHGRRVAAVAGRRRGAPAQHAPHPADGRLAPGASVSSAQTELTRLSADLERAYRENDGRGVFVEPLDAVVFGPARPALLMLWGAVGLVLLVGCVNVANLLLDQGPWPRA